MDEPTAPEAAPDLEAGTDGQPATTEAAGADGQPATMDQALGADGQLIDEIERSLSADPGNGQPVAPIELEELGGADQGAPTARDLDLLADVNVEVAVEFGRTRMRLGDLLTLRRGSLVELARRPEEQVMILANGTPIAYGDIVVVGDQVGVHIVELVAGASDAEEPQRTAAPAEDPAEAERD